MAKWFKEAPVDPGVRYIFFVINLFGVIGIDWWETIAAGVTFLVLLPTMFWVRPPSLVPFYDTISYVSNGPIILAWGILWVSPLFNLSYERLMLISVWLFLRFISGRSPETAFSYTTSSFFGIFCWINGMYLGTWGGGIEADLLPLLWPANFFLVDDYD
jgi:hypothetical protein